MHFLWPASLWLLAVLPLLALAYAWLLGRRRRAAVRVSSVQVARAAAGRSWRRHVPPALFLLACGLLLLAAARPVARVPLPWTRATVMLAMDVSLSMRVNDIRPTRLAAAQEAAKAFLRDLPRHVEVGLVTFAGTAQVAQARTLDREALVAAIDAFQMQQHTAIGNAIVVCLAELFPGQGIVLEDLLSGGQRTQGRSLDEKPRPPPPPPVAPGSNDAAVIILLSDGRRTTGVDTLEAAKMAADRGVRIHVVGLGAADGEAAGTDGLPIYLQLDEPTLREVARMTGGQYHRAATAGKLRSVYAQLGSHLEVARRETELAGLLALAAALVAITAGTLSVVWFRRFG